MDKLTQLLESQFPILPSFGNMDRDINALQRRAFTDGYIARATEEKGKTGPCLKSKTHAAMIGGARFPVRENLESVLYRGRWRIIQTDGVGDTYVEAPGEISGLILEKYEWIER